MSLPAPVTYAVVSGSLPPGITLSGTLLSGVPSIAGSYNFAIRATGSDATFVQRAYSIAVVEISPAILPDGTLNSPYAAALSIAGMASPEFSIIGALPAGLTLNPFTGVIAGTPTLAGDYSFGVLVTDGVTTCQQSYEITIAGGCVDWTSLLWAAPSFLGSSPETGETHSPLAGASSNSFHTTGFTIDASVFLTSFEQTALIAFDSLVDCNNNVHLILASTSASDPQTIGMAVRVRDANTLVQFLNYQVDGSTSGTIDVPFTLPAGTYTIEVVIDWSLSNFLDPGPATVDMQGTFTNV